MHGSASFSVQIFHFPFLCIYPSIYLSIHPCIFSLLIYLSSSPAISIAARDTFHLYRFLHSPSLYLSILYPARMRACGALRWPSVGLLNRHGGLPWSTILFHSASPKGELHYTTFLSTLFYFLTLYINLSVQLSLFSSFLSFKLIYSSFYDNTILSLSPPLFTWTIPVVLSLYACGL